MKFEYRRFRIAMLMFALGLAAVYMWRGLSIGMNEVSVDLPKINSGDEVLTIFPSGDPWNPYGDRTEQLLNGRNMSLYDTTEFSTECSFQAGKVLRSCLRKRDAAREFVYDHWKQQRRGYLQVGLTCYDCAPVYHIFIEPDQSGQWIISGTMEERTMPLKPTRIVDARFRKPASDEWWTNGSRRVLSLINERGQEVEAF